MSQDIKEMVSVFVKKTPAWYVGNAVKAIGNIVKTPFRVVWSNKKMSWPLKAGLLFGTAPFWLQGAVIDLTGSTIIKTQETLLSFTLRKLWNKK